MHCQILAICKDVFERLFHTGSDNNPLQFISLHFATARSNSVDVNIFTCKYFFMCVGNSYCMDVKIFTERMLEHRKERGLSHEELAERIGVSRAAISFWESGKNVPSAEHVSAMAKLFKVSMDYLVGNTNE